MTQLKYLAIILLSPIFHNRIEFQKGAVLSIPKDITEPEANRLIELNVAEFDKTSAGTPPLNEDEDEDDDNDISKFTKKQCMAELTEAKIEFNAKATLAELQALVIKHRASLLPPDDEHKSIDELTREELESELTARAIEFNADATDEDLRQLLIDDDNE